MASSTSSRLVQSTAPSARSNCATSTSTSPNPHLPSLPDRTPGRRGPHRGHGAPTFVGTGGSEVGATVDVDGRAGEVAGAFGQQERDYIAELFGTPGPAERDVHAPILDERPFEGL